MIPVVLKITFDDVDFRTAAGNPASAGVAKMANVLGKRYLCEKCATEVLCNKAGTGSFECCEVEMKLKEAKALPSSD
jgi:hypothetical protein